MGASSFSAEDLRQIRARGMTPEEVMAQIAVFKKGYPPVRLRRPCTVDDGIKSLGREEVEQFSETFKGARLSGRVLKFVPASGAASRMFKELLALRDRLELEPPGALSDSGFFSRFMEGLSRFAFYDDLKAVMAKDGVDIEGGLFPHHYKALLTGLLSTEGLNLAGLPKGLIKFHAYPDHVRTAFEEHLVEAADYARCGQGIVRIHFTVAPAHEPLIRAHLGRVLSRYERGGTRYALGFSHQKPATDTLAVDPGNRPFRDRQGRLVFRPGGHGALLENLNDLQGDIVFIKNIDNVVPDALKPPTSIYKKALGGYLVALQERTFACLRTLSQEDSDDRSLEEMFAFAREILSLDLPPGLAKGPREKRRETLSSLLNRPLRVCGMVRNEGEPGGGPFWVEDRDGRASLQIVESSQVDLASADQREIWESSTHFNPVDLVCGLRNFRGNPFDLRRFSDPDTGFIATKSKGGEELKALERPGLWNGAMAHWNTVFVEVPMITFNPVKTVLDLLRGQHQPQ